jgi:carbon monoxide dehydrogenase subunit G
MKRYALVTEWHLQAPIDVVWSALHDVASWPQWWPYVRKVVEIEPGAADGIGAVRRFTWSSRLPYQLSFNMRTTLLLKPHVMQAEAEGELAGTGCWTLQAEGRGTRVRYDWEVATTRAWMNLAAPLLAPVFRWNHAQVMAAGGRGLARYLNVSLLLR